MSHLPKGLNQNELAALEAGTDMYRAAISQEFGMFLGGLGIDESQIALVTEATAMRSRGLSLLEAKEVAEFMQRIRSLLGSTIASTVEIDTSETGFDQVSSPFSEHPPEVTSSAQTIHEEPQVSCDDSLNPTQNEAQLTIPAELIDNRSVRSLEHFFGQENRELLNQLTTDKSRQIVDAIIDALVTNKIIWSTQANMRSEQFFGRIFDRVAWDVFGKAGNTAQTTYSRSGRRMRETFDSQQRAAIIQRILDVPESIAIAGNHNETVPLINKVQSNPSEVEAANNETGPSSPSNIPTSKEVATNIETPCEPTPFSKLASAINRKDKDSLELIESLFETTRIQPDYSPEAREIYDDLTAALRAITDSKHFGSFAQTLEYKVFSLMAGGAADGGPLPPASVQHRVSKDLAAAKRKFREVIESGAGQIGDIRKKMRAA